MSDSVSILPFLVLERLLVFLGLQPGVFIVAGVCAALGAIILSRFTISLGFFSYVLNLIALFVAAVAANVVVEWWLQPLYYSLQQPLIASLVGIILASVAMLVLMGRSEQSD